MTDSPEKSEPDFGQTEGRLTSEQDRLNLYGQILYREATTLLGRYLPEALPQEPTEIMSGLFPQYVGRFKDKHYIIIERGFFDIYASLKYIRESSKRSKEADDQYEKENEEFFRLLEDNASKGICDEDIESKVFTHLKSEPEAKPEPDWKDPERLLKGRGEYSIDTWGGIYSLVHELIHQKQAELNPEAFPQLQSSDLDNTNPDRVTKAELKPLLIHAHKAHSRTMDDSSIFYPVIEGMAVLGSFYVMGKFLADLKKDRQDDLGKKIEYVRNETINGELNKTEGMDSYHLNYAQGVRLMRKLYKHFGLESTPRLLASVDLNGFNYLAETGKIKLL